LNRLHFGVQAAVVVSMVALVSWPEHRQLRATSVWRVGGPLSGQRGAFDRGGPGSDDEVRNRRFSIGWGSVALSRTSAAGREALLRRLFENAIENGRRKPIPADVLRLGGRLNGILGYARTAANGPLSFARIQLRNLQTGEIEAYAVANELGEFAFLDVVPSGYIVELLGPEGHVIAAEPLAIGAADVQKTLLEAPAPRALTTTFGGVMASTADEPMKTAASEGVKKVAAPDRGISPER
jgi:hypothetical protein